MNSLNLKNFIREIPDFPKEGILFRDISPLMEDPKIWAQIMNNFSQLCMKVQPDIVVGIEARGFIVGSSLAYKEGLGFIPFRKPGKLPGDVIGIDYKLEYGNDRLEANEKSLYKGIRVLLIDDLLATGGTAKAASDLIFLSQANLVGIGFIIELSELNGRKKLPKDVIIESLVKY